jgi:hypothetical protein
MKAHIRCFTLSDRPSLKATIDAICAEGCWMFTSNFQPTSSWRHALEEPTCSCQSAHSGSARSNCRLVSSVAF